MSVPLADRAILHVPLGRRFMRADETGFIELAKLHALISAHTHQAINIDASKVHSFDPALFAPLLIVIKQNLLNQNKITISGMGPLLRYQFQIHKIIASRPGLPKVPLSRLKRPPLIYLGLREFKPDQVEEFAVYSKNALDRPGLPVMSASLKASFFEGIDELFANSAMHSRTSINNVSCGVYNTGSNTLKFVVADGGQGMKGAYENKYKTSISSPDAINWSMTPGNTTRDNTGPGGLGLKIIREFIKLNGGKLSVVSREGYWTEKHGVVSRLRIGHSFPGTFVIIEINTLDKKSYALVKPDPNKIW